MDIVLYEPSKHIPNVALMRIANYHIQKGDSVSWDHPNPDIVYGSVIFTYEKDKAINEINQRWPNAKHILGGTGFYPDLSINLPNEIEFIRPYYDIYPENDCSIGSTTKGCFRNCWFCFIPKKEGKIRIHQHPKEFYDPRFKKIMLLDNNWLYLNDWFWKTSSWIIDHKLKVIEHGMDIRLIDNENANQIRRLRFDDTIKFAFDNSNMFSEVMTGLETLARHNIKIRHDVSVYTYLDNDSDDAFNDCLWRVNMLKDAGTNPFVMYNPLSPKSRRIIDLMRWANRKELLHCCSFENYKRTDSSLIETYEIPKAKTFTFGGK